MKNFDRIKAAIQASSLESADKMSMVQVYATIPDAKLQGIADLFEKKKNWVEISNDNRKKKIEALKTFDKTAWQAIVDEEKKYLEDLSFDRD